MTVLLTDAEFEDLSLERDILADAGLELEVAQCRSAEQVAEAAEGKQALLVQYAPITAEVFAACPDLEVVSRYGVGVDNVDVDAATEHGVWVANVPAYGVEEVSAHAVAMLLALLRHLPFHHDQVRNGTWDYAATGRIRRLSQCRLGLVGMGRIGRAVASTLGPLVEEVVATDPHVPAGRLPDGVRSVDLDELFGTSDAISLHAPLTPDTHGLVDARLLGRLPERGCHLVNTSRGGLVDLEAVVDALDGGRLLGVGLDVLPTEPPPEDHPVLAHPRALVTPHAAWYSEEAGRDMRGGAAANIVAWARRGRPTHVVNQPVQGP